MPALVLRKVRRCLHFKNLFGVTFAVSPDENEPLVGVHGPEGSSTPLLLLKRKVKKLIDEEDPRKPLTDDLIASMLEAQGIDVTRRTVAKYREDLRIPSTHQRRVRD